MCETESRPWRQQLLKPSSHIDAANLEERTENECEIEMGLHCERILTVEWARGCVQLAIRTSVYIEESAQSPHCQL